jgi:hypothetical protein
VIPSELLRIGCRKDREVVRLKLVKHQIVGYRVRLLIVHPHEAPITTRHQHLRADTVFIMLDRVADHRGLQTWGLLSRGGFQLLAHPLKGVAIDLSTGKSLA